jgi:isoleucyl-tRNA synthetase
LNSNFISTEDLINGTVKLDGERKHGFGLDTLRAWAIVNDKDTNNFIDRQSFEEVNNEVKLLRSLLRVLLGNLSSFQHSEFNYN